ncbi:MAG: hypothetical protein ACOCUT_01300 [bacterium]
MASPKITWDRLWKSLILAIPNPDTYGRLIVALDDCINPKVGKKIFACHKFFDHATKDNQSRCPWAQNIVVAGLLKKKQRAMGMLELIYQEFNHSILVVADS